MCSCKREYSRVPCALCPVPPSGNMWRCYTVMAQPGLRDWHDPPISFRFHMHSRVCVFSSVRFHRIRKFLVSSATAEPRNTSLTAKTLRLNFYNHAHFPPVSAPPPSLPDPWQALLCSHLHNFIIARMLCKNHTVWKLLGLASFLLSIISWRFIKVVRCSLFLFITESGSMVWTNHSLTIQPLEGIWITFSF